MVVDSVVSCEREDRVGQWILSAGIICAWRAGGARSHSAPFDAKGGARSRQEFTRRLLCNRQWAIRWRNRQQSASTLFRRAWVPVGVRKMSPAIPLTAARAMLLSVLVAGFIHTRNCLTELFFGFCGCCVHRILHGTKDGAAGKDPSGRVPLRQLCSRRWKQYTPARRPLPPYCEPGRHPKEWSRARTCPSSDKLPL